MNQQDLEQKIQAIAPPDVLDVLVLVLNRIAVVVSGAAVVTQPKLVTQPMYWCQAVTTQIKMLQTTRNLSLYHELNQCC